MKNVSVCYTGNEIPKIVRKAKDFTLDEELKSAIEHMYVLGIKCYEIEKALGYKSGTLGYACDLAMINLIEPTDETRCRKVGKQLLKEWKNK